ncbi:MAG: hypothetical protein MOGMAGMI_00110 [Candidatus Omnitrophica bacterium]|nr:hypothetical protein [Candidatus Omnitrophota bacterium]
MTITESSVENTLLTWFKGLGYDVLFGPDISLGGDQQERSSYDEVVLVSRLRRAVQANNPNIPASAIEDAINKVLRASHPSLIQNNHHFYRWIVEGVPVEYQAEGRSVHDQVVLINFSDPSKNEWLCVNQFAIKEGNHSRRPDVVVFVNGLPLAVIELKNPTDENATLRTAFNQLETYKNQIPTVFNYNAFLIISDGIEAKVGTLTSNWERFMPWRTVDGSDLAPKTLPQLDVLIRGIFFKSRFLDMLRHFIVFEDMGHEVSKKMAGYHQFHAVQKAVTATVQARKKDHRIGVVWHTQGSGKSLTMTFYAGKLIQNAALENPTLLVLTDRNDLDDQLYQTFCNCSEILRQTPKKSESRENLRDLLSVASGGVVFSTIQKFLPEEKGEKYPLLSDRSNIVVICDEAHRSHYDFMKGFAKHLRDALPQALFIGFTATPIELRDKSTRAIFGDTIDTYDIHQSIEDGATVPIYYEARLAKISLPETEKPKVDIEFEEVTEQEEATVARGLASRWSRLEALVGAEKRVKQIAKDIVEHYETRLTALDGKGLVVSMSRKICVALYDEIIKLRPDWHSENDDEGRLKVVMTGSASDPVDWQKHIRDKQRRSEIGDKFKDPEHPIKLVIVRDMWLTGFDVPCLHTMYIDKPMRGHGLMQAIARVNRVFSDKPGGLVVDYLGIAHELKKALAEYSSQDRDDVGISQDEAVAVLLEKHEIIKGLLHGYDYKKYFKANDEEKLRILVGAMEHILALFEIIEGKEVRNGRDRYLKAVLGLSRAFALAVPHEKALEIRQDVAFFQSVKSALVKNTEIIGPGKAPEDLNAAIQQIISKSVLSDGVVDILSAAGLKRPDISVLSDEFLHELKGMPHKNLAAEALYKLIHDEVRLMSKKFLIQAKSFSDRIEETINRYHARAIEAVQVIEELIKIAKELKEARKRGEKIGLNDDELAFYDALETNDSAVKVLGDDTLRAIARELVETVRNNASIDWTVRENVRAKLRVMVRRVLRKHGYPPDLQEQATSTVLQQAELICADIVQ